MGNKSAADRHLPAIIDHILLDQWTTAVVVL